MAELSEGKETSDSRILEANLKILICLKRIQKNWVLTTSFSNTSFKQEFLWFLVAIKNPSSMFSNRRSIH
jgi:hypothetical protein